MKLTPLVGSSTAGTAAARDAYISTLASGALWTWTLLDSGGTLLDIQSGKKA